MANETPIEGSWEDLRPGTGPEPPERPPETPQSAPSLAERARAMHDAFALLGEVEKYEGYRPEFEIKVSSRVGSDFSTKTKHASIGGALEELTALVNDRIALRVQYARDARERQRKEHETAEAELARVEGLLSRGGS